ncbi:MAG: hypothetical protein HYX68_24170 [Planctomycetes bacterium]|jgi:hypothetical protein|nr:hypothetical protein [Planctomycetota bacterium]
MTLSLRTCWTVFLGLGLLFAAGGCSKKVVARGQLLDKGKAVTFGVKDRMFMNFHPDGEPESGKKYLAKVNAETGEFEIRDADGSGIPPGKYKVTAMLQSPYPMGQDRWKDKYSFRNSKLVVDVGDTPLEIDLGK